MVTQKEIISGEHGTVHYEITFVVLADKWLSQADYNEISDRVDAMVLRPGTTEALCGDEILDRMRWQWNFLRRDVAFEISWRKGFEEAYKAAGGDINDLK
jgi:hypothetical protein